MKCFFILALTSICLLSSWRAPAAPRCEKLLSGDQKALLPLQREKHSLEERLLPIALDEGRRAGLNESEIRSHLNYYLATGMIGGPIHLEALFFGETLRSEDYEGFTEAKIVKAFGPYLADGERGDEARYRKSSTMARIASANARLSLAHTQQSMAALLGVPASTLLAALYERTLPDAIGSVVTAVPGRLTRARFGAKKLGFNIFVKSAWTGVFLFPAGLGIHNWQIAVGGFAAAYTGVNAGVVLRLKQQGHVQSVSKRALFETSRFLKIATRTDRWLSEEKALEALPLTREELAPFDLGETYESLSQKLRYEISKSDLAAETFLTNPDSKEIESITDDAITLAKSSITTIELALERDRQIRGKRSALEKFLEERSASPHAVTDLRVEELNSRFDERLQANDLDLDLAFQTLATMAETLRRGRENAEKLKDEPLVAHLESCLQKIEKRERELKRAFAKL